MASDPEALAKVLGFKRSKTEQWVLGFAIPQDDSVMMLTGPVASRLSQVMRVGVMAEVAVGTPVSNTGQLTLRFNYPAIDEEHANIIAARIMYHALDAFELGFDEAMDVALELADTPDPTVDV